MPDSSGKAVSKVKATETQIVASCLQALMLHRCVAWVNRMNVGAVKIKNEGKERFVRFAFKGCSDIIGQLTDGRFLAVECKVQGNKMTEAQQGFLDKVALHNGVSGVAYSSQDALDIVDAAIISARRQDPLVRDFDLLLNELRD